MSRVAAEEPVINGGSIVDASSKSIVIAKYLDTINRCPGVVTGFASKFNSQFVRLQFKFSTIARERSSL